MVRGDATERKEMTTSLNLRANDVKMNRIQCDGWCVVYAPTRTEV